ncbi:MAG: DUF6356 family protein [Defluviicoccus sp.]|nr:DUF6356 family protein [Defluviicoccus sp.]
MGRQRTATPARPILGAFTDHPASVGETYAEHMGVALSFGARLLGAGCAAIVHALVPALFQTAASDAVRTMHAELESRLDPPGGA